MAGSGILVRGEGATLELFIDLIADSGCGDDYLAQEAGHRSQVVPCTVPGQYFLHTADVGGPYC